MMAWAAYAILGFVTLQRLAELPLARINTQRLLESGGFEVGRGHYPWIVALHAGWLAALWWLAPGRPIDLALLGLFGLVELGRLWVLWTLGRRWTTRIIVVPGEKLVASGPFRFIRHPNYAVVTAEIALLPAVFGLWAVAAAFTLLNGVMMIVRIRTEDAALSVVRTVGGRPGDSDRPRNFRPIRMGEDSPTAEWNSGTERGSRE